MVTNGNFPAALQVLALLGTALTIVVLGAAAMYGGIARRGWTRLALLGIAGVVGIYIVLLISFSVASGERVLKVGEEKYFCEMDCHLAYSVVEVGETDLENGKLLLVKLKTRFDEATISPRRPKEAPLEPNPRLLTLIDAARREYSPARSEPMVAPTLRPGESYISVVEFPVPQETKGLKLLITSADGPERVLIGNERSFLHKKVYFQVH